MCVNDWRLGRLIKSQATVITAPAALQAIVDRNKDRVGLTLSVAEALSEITVQVEDSGTFRGVAILTPAWPFIHFTMAEFGDLPTKKWRVGVNTAGLSLTVIEYFLPEQVLAQVIEKYYSGYRL